MPELLEEDIRATAPEPREEFVARLERRVETGFAKPPKPRRERTLWWTGAGPVLAVSLVALFVVFVSLAGNGSDDSGSSGGGSESSVAQQPEPNSPASGDEGSAGSGVRDLTQKSTPAPTAPVAPGSERRKVERRTALDLRTGEDDFPEVTAGVLRIADSTGTIVQRSNVTQRDGSGFATYDLRVPASRLDDALAELSELGDVRSRTASADDITAAFVSARDRLEDARDERQALLRGLARADSERERALIRVRLREARQRIARAERDVRRINARTDRARVDVTVRSTGESGSWTPGDALDDAGRILEVIAGIVLVVGAVLLPLLLLALAAIAAGRLTRRRRRNAVLG